jgi:hypothetical protein
MGTTKTKPKDMARADALRWLRRKDVIAQLGSKECSRMAKAIKKQVENVRAVAPSSTWADDWKNAKPSNKAAEFPPGGRSTSMIECKCCLRLHPPAYVNTRRKCYDCHIEGRTHGRLNPGHENRMAKTTGSILSVSAISKGVYDPEPAL